MLATVLPAMAQEPIVLPVTDATPILIVGGISPDDPTTWAALRFF